MKYRNVIMPIFVVMVLAQLYVPASMIFGREKTLTAGLPFRFRTEPIDPNDPFRGKYIILDFAQDTIRVKGVGDWDWQYGETVFVVLGNDDEGMAIIESVARTAPKNVTAYVMGSVSYVSERDSISGVLHIDFPFNRYYMEESKAMRAEQAYIDANRDTARTAYALVMVRNGDAVVKDVFIDDVSIHDVIANDAARN